MPLLERNQSSAQLFQFSQDKKSSPFYPGNTDVGFPASEKEWNSSLWNEAGTQGLEIQKYFPGALQPVCNGLPG